MASLTLELQANAATGFAAKSFATLPLVNHVHKRLEQFIYTDIIQPESVPVAYVENPELDSWRNIQIADRSYSIPQNSPSRVGLRAPFDKVTATSYSSEYKSLLITNQTFVDEFGRTRPLFYKHTLAANVTQCSLRVSSGGQRHDVDSGYVVDLENSVIYTNYLNFFNPDTGAYRLYFVVCTDDTGERTHTLLNPTPVAKEATWEDIDLDTGTLTKAYPVYSQERNTSGYTYYFNEGDTWYIRPLEQSLIRTRLPVGREPEDPWYLRFTDGDITAVTNSASRQYYVPEYDQQNFVPSKPIRFSVYERMLWVNRHTLAATRKNLNIDPENGLHITFYVYDVEGVLIRVFSTDTSKSGTRYSDTDVFYETDVVASWDNGGGLISMGVKLHPSWTVRSQYYYEADDYEYSLLNLNPLSNDKALDHMFVFYIIPDVDSDDRAIHHLIVDQGGIIIACSQDEGFAYGNLQLFDSGGAYNSDTVIGTKYISDVDTTTFITEYTTGHANDNGYAVLAEVSVLDLGREEEQLVYDVRRPGASITAAAFDTATRGNPRILQSVYGYGEDGQEVPLNAVLHIRAPITLLEDYGGDLTEEAATELLTAHLNSASYPVIEWTYLTSDITADPQNVGQVDLSWTWEAPGVDYRLYRRDNPTEEWGLIYTEVSPALGTMSYSDTLVTSGEVFYYAVRVYDGTYEYPIGNSVGVKVT